MALHSPNGPADDEEFSYNPGLCLQEQHTDRPDKHRHRLEGLLVAHTMSGALFLTALSSQLSSNSAS